VVWPPHFAWGWFGYPQTGQSGGDLWPKGWFDYEGLALRVAPRQNGVAGHPYDSATLPFFLNFFKV
jgi:hypothetical protein